MWREKQAPDAGAIDDPVATRWTLCPAFHTCLLMGICQPTREVEGIVSISQMEKLRPTGIRV